MQDETNGVTKLVLAGVASGMSLLQCLVIGYIKQFRNLIEKDHDNLKEKFVSLEQNFKDEMRETNRKIERIPAMEEAIKDIKERIK